MGKLVKKMFFDELWQKGIYDKKAKEREDVYFETLRDSFGFKFCRTLKDLKFRDLVGFFNPRSGEKVLDVGCFSGHILNRLSVDFKIKGYGVDISPLAIKLAKEYRGKSRFFVASGYNLPFNKNYFDGIISLDVLEHISNKKEFIKELFRVLKPNGWFVIYSVSRRSKYTFNWLRWLFKKNPRNEYGEWKEAGHKAKLLTNIGDIEKLFNGKIIYFHSFFTLIFDLYIARIFNKFFHLYLKKFGKKRLFLLEKIFLFVYSFIFRFALFLSELLDFPWKTLALSNGFFIVGRKKA